MISSVWERERQDTSFSRSGLVLISCKVCSFTVEMGVQRDSIHSVIFRLAVATSCKGSYSLRDKYVRPSSPRNWLAVAILHRPLVHAQEKRFPRLRSCFRTKVVFHQDYVVMQLLRSFWSHDFTLRSHWSLQVALRWALLQDLHI